MNLKGHARISLVVMMLSGIAIVASDQKSHKIYITNMTNYDVAVWTTASMRSRSCSHPGGESVTDENSSKVIVAPSKQQTIEQVMFKKGQKCSCMQECEQLVLHTKFPHVSNSFERGEKIDCTKIATSIKIEIFKTHLTGSFPVITLNNDF